MMSGIISQQGCRAVAMVDVTINDHDFVDTIEGQGMAGSKCQIVDETKTTAKVMMGMVIAAAQVNAHTILVG